MAQNPPFTRDTQAAQFVTTQWTVVLAAGGSTNPEAAAALQDLCQSYWLPVHAFVRRRGYPPPEAEDLTQDFFLRLIEKRSLAGIEREGGRFRSFLLGSLQHFLANEWDRSRAQKRGSGERPLSLDAEAGEVRLALAHAESATPETWYERQWAFTLLQRVADQLRAEYAADGRVELFDQLKACLQGDRQGPAYAEVAAQRGMTEGAIKVTVHRMRRRYGELLRAGAR